MRGNAREVIQPGQRRIDFEPFPETLRQRGLNSLDGVRH